MTHSPDDAILEGKSVDERLAMARAILIAAHLKLCPLSAAERQAIPQFIALTVKRRPIDAALLPVVGRLFRALTNPA